MIGDVQVGQPLDTQDEQPIRLRIIGVPILIIAGDSAVIDQSCENNLVGVFLWLVDVARVIVTRKQRRAARAGHRRPEHECRDHCDRGHGDPWLGDREPAAR